MKYSSTLYELVVLTFLWIIWQSKVNTCSRNIYYTIHVSKPTTLSSNANGRAETSISSFFGVYGEVTHKVSHRVRIFTSITLGAKKKASLRFVSCILFVFNPNIRHQWGGYQCYLQKSLPFQPTQSHHYPCDLLYV